MLEVEPLVLDPPPRPAAPGPPPLEAELIGRGITPAVAADLVREHGEEAVRLQIDILDSLPEKTRDRIADPAAYLVTAIRNGHVAPKGYVSREERQAREQARQTKERAEVEDRQRRREEAAREQTERQAINAFWSALTPEQQAELDAAATSQADPAEVAQEWGALGKLGERLRRDVHIRQLITNQATPPHSSASDL